MWICVQLVSSLHSICLRLMIWNLCVNNGDILILFRCYYCKNYFIYQVYTCIRPNACNNKKNPLKLINILKNVHSLRMNHINTVEAQYLATQRYQNIRMLPDVSLSEYRELHSPKLWTTWKNWIIHRFCPMQCKHCINCSSWSWPIQRVHCKFSQRTQK